MASIQNSELKNLFEQREQEVMSNVLKNAKEIAEIEMGLFEFELFFSSVVDEKKSRENAEWVCEHREKKWKEALKKAKGDEAQALAIYGAI